MTHRLSKRCTEVLGWVFVGKSNEEIGVILGLRTCTVKNHVAKIIRKLGAYNRQNAIYQALKYGLLQAPQPEGPPTVVPPPPAPPVTVHADDWLSAGNVHLSPSLRIAIANEKTLDVAGVRFRLLEALLKRPGFPLSRRQILDHTHGHEPVAERTVDIHVHRLRVTLEASGADHTVHAERGVGFRIGPVSAA